MAKRASAMGIRRDVSGIRRGARRIPETSRRIPLADARFAISPPLAHPPLVRRPLLFVRPDRAGHQSRFARVTPQQA